MTTMSGHRNTSRGRPGPIIAGAGTRTASLRGRSLRLTQAQPVISRSVLTASVRNISTFSTTLRIASVALEMVKWQVKRMAWETSHTTLLKGFGDRSMLWIICLVASVTMAAHEAGTV